MQRIRAFTSLGLILAGEFVVLGFLAAADWIPSALQILDAPPDAAIYGMARMIAIGLTAWLFITTIAVVLAHVSRIPTAIRTIEWITIPLISRMAQRVTALSIVAAGLAAPTSSLATEPPPIPVVVVSGHVDDYGHVLIGRCLYLDLNDVGGLGIFLVSLDTFSLQTYLSSSLCNLKDQLCKVRILTSWF